MKLSKEFIQQVKDSTDMVELASEYLELKQTGRDLWQGKCPNPKHNDHTASFTVSKKKQNWCCFGCHSEKKNISNKNYGTDCIAFIQWINDGKLSWFDSVKFLAKRANMLMPDDKYAYLYKRNYGKMNKYMKDITEEGLDYLTSRGLDESDIAKWSIGFNLETNRITFPLINQAGVVGFNERRIDDSTDKKYIHSPNSQIFNKSSFLYGLTFIDRSYKYIYITEGVMDVILATKYGLKNVVCVLGSAFSEEHFNTIKSIGLKPVLLFDGDIKGKKAIESAMDLIYNKGEYCLTSILEDSCDLADYALQYKDNLSEVIEQNISTYGFTKAINLIEEYNRKLYILKAGLRPKIDSLLEQVPEEEKEEIKGYLEEELKIKS